MGLGPGIDVGGTALRLLPELGFGWLTVGPIGAAPPVVPRGAQRLLHLSSLVRDDQDGPAPPLARLSQRLEARVRSGVPVGVALRGPDIVAAAHALSVGADFYTLPGEATESEIAGIARLRPTLLRLAPEWSARDVEARLDLAVSLGVVGVVAVDGARWLPTGTARVHGPFLTDVAVEVVRRIRSRWGDQLLVVGAGGVHDPGAALRLLDAGATLVELYDGLVYGGPGLPRKINQAIGVRTARRELSCLQSRG